MTTLEWIGAGALDFVMSLLAFMVVLHYDLEGWWQQYHVQREARKNPLPPAPRR